MSLDSNITAADDLAATGFTAKADYWDRPSRGAIVPPVCVHNSVPGTNISCLKLELPCVREILAARISTRFYESPGHHDEHLVERDSLKDFEGFPSTTMPNSSTMHTIAESH